MNKRRKDEKKRKRGTAEAGVGARGPEKRMGLPSSVSMRSGETKEVSKKSEMSEGWTFTAVGGVVRGKTNYLIT